MDGSKRFTESASAAGRQQHAEPYRQISQRHAGHDVDQPDPWTASADGAVSFVFESGKCGVTTEKADHQQQSPVGVRLEALREQSHQQADEKRTRNVDDQGAQWKAPAEAVHDSAACDITRERTCRSAEHDQKIFFKQALRSRGGKRRSKNSEAARIASLQNQSWFLSLGESLRSYIALTAISTVGVIGRSIPAVVVDSTTCSKHTSGTVGAQESF